MADTKPPAPGAAPTTDGMAEDAKLAPVAVALMTAPPAPPDATWDESLIRALVEAAGIHALSGECYSLKLNAAESSLRSALASAREEAASARRALREIERRTRASRGKRS